MLKDIRDDEKEIIRYLRYNRVAVRVHTLEEYHFFLLTKLNCRHLYYNPNPWKVGTFFELMRHKFEPFSFSLFSEIETTKCDYIYINKLHSYDRVKQYTVLDLDQLITCYKRKIVLKLPKYDSSD